jgi:hypothetical protein
MLVVEKIRWCKDTSKRGGAEYRRSCSPITEPYDMLPTPDSVQNV